MKTIELVISERSDSWIETHHIQEDETLRDLMQRRGFNWFDIEGIDSDNAQSIYDGMTVRVRIMSEPHEKDFP